MKINVATCQFPTDSDIRSNLQYVSRQMKSAKEQGAHVAHFPEACLSGYAGADFLSYKDFNWDLLEQCTREILELARQIRLWVILGSTHRLSGQNKPHNSLYIINDEGQLVDRYDKMFCAGDESGETGDLAHYSSGNHFSVFGISGVRCGALICHDYRYPELYREYKRRGVQLMFHSYHAAHIPAERFQAMQDEVGAEHQKLNQGMKSINDLDRYSQNGGLEPSLLDLINLRASQINGCAYCIDMHSKEPLNESLQGLCDMTVVDPDGNKLRICTRLKGWSRV